MSVALKDHVGNVVYVSEDSAAALLTAGGWDKAEETPAEAPVKTRPKVATRPKKAASDNTDR